VLRQINAQLEGDQISPEDVISWRSGVRPLVIEAGTDKSKDWHALSRKHVIEANSRLGVVTVLGGKLTDCLNVGQEVVTEFRKLGFAVRRPRRWFGEGAQLRRAEFDALVDELTADAQASKRIAEAIWRRHGERGFEILANAKLVSELVPGLGVTAQEIQFIVRNESVKNREDLLRRRLPIQMARSEQEIAQNLELQALLKDLGL
jgi:glycerol-3-phosphate dehydrogenase